MKRLFAFLVLFALLASLCSPAAFAVPREELAPYEGEDAIEIASVADFLAFAAACSRDVYSLGQVFSLTADIDLSGTDFTGVPYFAGSFHGNGHSILGLSVGCDGSRMGLFRRVAEGAAIRDLKVFGSVKPGGTAQYVGGIAGVNEGSILRCVFSGSVQGLDGVGGIVGLNGASGLVDQCGFYGDLRGEHQAGGIVGENAGVISRCTNSGLVNTEAFTPQSESRFDLALLSEDDFVDLANIGGIAGLNDGVVSACVNGAAVGYKNTAYNVGGVCGKSTGYLVGCRNSGVVNGRRDVGGIVGQLIPSETWDFTNDRLELLSGQLGSMNYLIAKAAQHASENTEALSAELSVMNASTSTAISELEGILRSYENNDSRILDSIHVDPLTGEVTLDRVDLSGVNTSGLTSALADMNAAASIISNMLRDTMADTTEDLTRIVRQMSAIMGSMTSLIANASGELYENFDLSADECYDHDIGAVSACFNYGDVLAENNAGGVAGTVGYEISFDMENSLNASSFLTSDASRYIFAVLRDCESYCEVQTKSDAAGGVVGSLEVGAAVSCVGAGAVASQSGNYVGGVAGQSQGTIRGCWARALLSGGRYVGGIAGLANDLDGCRSWAHIESASEYAGAVAGWAGGAVSGNLYVDEGPAGIDNVSLSGMTDPLQAEEFLRYEGCPEDLGDLSVRFVAGDETVAVVSVPFGGGIETLPEVENDGLRYWKWDDFPREHIYYSITVGGKYYTPGSTLSSGGELPLFLVEGVFYEGQQLTVAEYPVAEPGDDLLAAYTLFVQGYDGDLIVHMRTDESGRVFVIDESGAQSAVQSRVDGQYLVFSMPNGGSFVYRRALPVEDHTLWIAGGGAVLAAAALVLLIRGRKKKKQASQIKTESDAEVQID